MAAGLTHVQRNNMRAAEERRAAALLVERIAEEEGDALGMWEALKREGIDHLIDGVLEQRDIDMAVRDALARGGWQAVQRLMEHLPDRCQEAILSLDGAGAARRMGAFRHGAGHARSRAESINLSFFLNSSFNNRIFVIVCSQSIK